MCMSNKFSIVNTLDFDRLDTEIKVHILKTATSPYIFMNDGTINEMERVHCVNNDSKDTAVNTGFIGRYNGCKIFVDNTLGFGEVEIR